MPSRPRLPHALPGTPLLAAIFVTLGAGCRSHQAQLDSATAYPVELTQSGSLDVQAIRDGTSLTITNTSARRFGPSTLWPNRWYSFPIESFEVGETRTFDLGAFRDRHGETFRAGGFFATRRPDRAVLLQVQTDDELIGLVVIDRAAR